MQLNPKYNWILYVGIIIYYEIIFCIATGSGFFDFGTILMILFSIAYGILAYLLCTLSKSHKFNYWFTFGLMAISAYPFIMEYFVFRQFKVFYDLNTLLNGAGGVINEFFDETLKLIFSPTGLTNIILFILPSVLFLLFGYKRLNLVKDKRQSRKQLLITSAICYLSSILVMQSDYVYAHLYNKEYNFQNATSNFGLLSSFRLDIKSHLVNPIKDFDEQDQTPVSNSKNEYHQLDIDFDQLIKDCEDENIIEIHNYVSSLTPSKTNKYTGLFEGKNLIFITAEAFTKQVIDPVLTPTLYRMHTRGIVFNDYTQPDSAGTTGGEYQNIFGMLPTLGGASFKTKADHFNYYTIGTQLNALGYYGKAYHNNTYTFYERDKTHNTIGYSDGFMGYGNGLEKLISDQWPQSDLEMIQSTLPSYIDKDRFNIYYMSVSGHSNYSIEDNAMTKKNWDKVKHMNCSDEVKGYLAANLELENALTYLIEQLEAKKLADDTVIIVAPDHFPYGLDPDAPLGQTPFLNELYGEEVTSLLQRDQNVLLMWSGCLEDDYPIVIDEPTSSLDILPTLFNLFNIEYDSRLLPGRDVFSEAEALVFNTSYDFKTSLGTYHSKSGEFISKEANVEVSQEYIDEIRLIVRNKINYCKSVLEYDYFRILFDQSK